MEVLVPKYRRNPNEKIEAIYSGVTHGNRTVTTIVKPSLDRNRMEKTRIYGPAMPRGVSGRVAVLVLGGMETTLDEMEYIVAAKKAQKFVPRRGMSEIAEMCRMVAERRNEAIMEARKRPPKPVPQPKPTPKKKVGLYLPVGYKWAPTATKGLRVAVRS
jgi:hypothetical protein